MSVVALRAYTEMADALLQQAHRHYWYSRSAGLGRRTQLREAAEAYGRLALSLIPSYAALLLHEILHIDFPGDHCKKGCCFQVISNSWLCRVSAYLGLYKADDDGILYKNSSDELGAVYTRTINLNIDTSGGQSGGPIFYCPANDDNVCAAGEEGYVLAVQAGYNPVTTNGAGPKIPFYKTWIDSMIFP